MSAPTISLINNYADMTEVIADKFWYLLYADDDQFDEWKEWVQDPANEDDATYN